MEKAIDTSFDDMVKLDYFADIGKAITSASTMKQVLQAVMEQVASVFAPSNWSVLLKKEPSGDLVFVSVTGTAVEALQNKVLPRGQGIAGWIAENAQPLIIENVQTDSRFDPSMDAESGFVTRSIIGVPLKTRTKVFGVIELVNKLDGSPFSPYDLKLLTTIADFAAIALEKMYYMQTLKRFAFTDHLTGLNNRRMLYPAIEREIQRSERSGIPFAVLFIDINDFKTINDKYGHDLGDMVLQTVSQVIKQKLRKGDFACRFGGDEFVIILSGHTAEQAQRLKERIISDPRLSSGLAGNAINLSFGIKEATGGDARSILKEVDKDMYQEKMQSIEDAPEDMPTAFEEATTEDN